ncbi:MAG TPA: hypothetical protein VJB13_02420 [Candidatus Nanoarchaeia archaeon]|nr:hypothetical protein [Candidatus Nanoarchaeia archaeon]
MQNSFRKSSVIAFYGAIMAALGIYRCSKTNRSDSHSQAVRPTEKSLKSRTSEITLENLIISNKDPYFCYADKGKDSIIREFASLADSQGNFIFNCEELFAYQKEGGDFQYAKSLVSFKDQNEKALFTGRDIFAYKGAGGTIDYATKFLSAKDPEGRNIFTGAQLPLLYRLGLDLPEMINFKDTSKPNALFICPTNDNNPSSNGLYKEGVFRNDLFLDFFKGVKKAYDVKIIVASKEDEIYQPLLLPTNFEYLVLAGHGNATSLVLGSKDTFYNQDLPDEKLSLDISDTEFEKYLQNLSPKAVIFLYSCETGKGGKAEKNLANTISGWAKNREVIAPTEVLVVGQVNVHSFYPFEVTLKNAEGKDDITYRAGQKFVPF